MPAHVTLEPKRFALAIGAVVLGGGVGTLLRDLALKLQPIAPVSGATWVTQVPWILLAINATGVYAATRLLRTVLRAHDPNDPWRLLLITGLLGGFTSYSSLVAAWAAIWHHSVVAGLGVAVGSLGTGVLAAWLGLRRNR